MKQPLDHLRSKKKPARKTIWVAGDSELAEELSELQERLSREENMTRSIPEGSSRREDALERLEELRAEVEAKRAQVRETSIKFVLQAIPRKKYEEILEAHPPTAKQVEDYKSGGNKDSIEFNPDTFPMALIAACTVEPDVEHEELEAWLRDGDEWNNAEVLTLFMTAMEVNQSRRIVNLGKD
jgi:predicted RND superfamily exporter protein